jgi:hypothetical protein
MLQKHVGRRDLFGHLAGGGGHLAFRLDPHWRFHHIPALRLRLRNSRPGFRSAAFARPGYLAIGL